MNYTNNSYEYERVDENTIKLRSENLFMRLLHRVIVWLSSSLILLFMGEFTQHTQMLWLRMLMMVLAFYPLYAFVNIVLVFFEKEYLILDETEISYEVRIFSLKKIRKRFKKSDENYFDIIEQMGRSKSGSIYFTYRVIFVKNGKVKYPFGNAYSQRDNALSFCYFLNENLVGIKLEMKEAVEEIEVDLV